MGVLFTKIIMLPGIILGLSLHEFAHAWMSNKLGDPTPERQGRLTVNPMAHIDWVGFLALLLVGFGWGKPVEIDPRYYKHPRRDEFLVAIAGVTMNLIIAVILSFPTKALMSLYYRSGTALIENVFLIFYYAVMINLVLMIFNLIPCPPLDGWNIVTQLFKLDKYKWWYKVYQYGTWILLGLIVLDVTDMIITPAVTTLLRLLGL
jgi:Zn-dependent protease